MDDDEFDFKEYDLGQLMEYTEDHGATWTEGTLVRIDEDDPDMPWGITRTPIEDVSQETIDEHVNGRGEWAWYTPNQVRSGHYVDSNFVIQEDTLLSACW